MTSEFDITGTITFEEYLECHRVLAAKRRLWIRGVVITYGVALVVYSFFPAESSSSMALLALGLGAIFYGTLISPVQFRYRVKRNWNRYPKMRKPFHFSVSEDGVATLDDKGSPSHTNWDSFVSFRESKSLYLLYLSPLLPLCLPKRLVPEADQERLKEVIKSSIDTKKHRAA